ncbi:MAG TPA: NTP transferase domain-containing protein [Bacteriovoracaceae bacterium]|nr:NTP transferase domain-containing protein [Bacteriovoracaceae bacterium]
MRPITYIICAAGNGERFRSNGLDLPKPLIKFNGKTMLERSLQSLEVCPGDQIILITRATDKVRVALPQDLASTWLEIEAPTGSQLETALLAESKILHEDLAIYNCDTFFRSENLRSDIEDGNYDGIIPCSLEPGSSWSFCEVDTDDNVLRVAEKERISDWASVGYYYFKGKGLFLETAKEECRSVRGKEAYVAPLYNRYLAARCKIKMNRVDEFLPFGTFDQINDYWGITLDELITQNR